MSDQNVSRLTSLDLGAKFKGKIAVKQRRSGQCSVACVTYVLEDVSVDKGMFKNYEYVSRLIEPFRTTGYLFYPSEICEFLADYGLTYEYVHIGKLLSSANDIELEPNNIILVTYLDHKDRAQPHYIVYAGLSDRGEKIFMDCCYPAKLPVEISKGTFTTLEGSYRIAGYLRKQEEDWDYEQIDRITKGLKLFKSRLKKPISKFKLTFSEEIKPEDMQKIIEEQSEEESKKENKDEKKT